MAGLTETNKPASQTAIACTDLFSTMNIHEITTKLIGPISAEGETNADEKRFENLEETIGLVEDLVYDLTRAAATRDRPEASMSKIGKRAQGFLNDLRDSLENDQAQVSPDKTL